MATKTMNISLSEYWQGYVAGHIRRGRYQNASELMREALRLHEREQIAREVSEVEALFGATGKAEGTAEIEQIDSAVKAARKDMRGRSR
ncbi:MAG: type II toxin-antitoxin system ParD family antitoxin [Verrucomicrobiota bacterium]